MRANDETKDWTMVALTIGMATYNDFDGVYFTIQALRLYQDLADTELLVVDNYGCDTTRPFVEGWAKGRYLLAKDVQGTAAPRDLVFREARGEAVLCCDSHVLFFPGVIAKLMAYYRKHPQSIDLLQGPLVYDDLQAFSTHFDPVWREQMWGIWATDERGKDPNGKPFDIPMQGLGVFSCRKAAWPGFHPAFRGFGGEEGYIHEKFRQRGGRTLCLPWLRWVHRFQRPKGVPYSLSVEDKFRNYLIGHAELGLDLEPVLEHFAKHLRPESFARVRAEAEEALRAASATKEKAPKKVRKPSKRKRKAAATPEPAMEPAPAAPAPRAPADERPAVAAEAAAPPVGRNGDVAQPLQGFVFDLSGDADLDHPPSLRTIPLFAKTPAETDENHVVRVARLVAAAADAGSTHLLIPSAAADWLGDHPLVTEYLAAYHQPIAASRETGFLFALRAQDDSSADTFSRRR
jgi:glycosyltransferase involved in cell wall biosynthesis